MFSRLFLIILLYPFAVNANCDFTSSSYIKELQNPSFINKINIEVPDSKKFAKNFIKALLSETDNIQNKYKKKFKAKVSVEYKFGSCEYKAKIRQTGDWKDHLGWSKTGKPIQSLSVSLHDGNILNAVNFKLLIPETRLGANEVMGTVILRELGFISPETFEVNASVNGSNGIFLFQEKAAKELLERNHRREGPIFEGDETVIWGNGRLSNDDVALARLVNGKWMLRGPSSKAITIHAMGKLQSALANSLLDHKKYGYYIELNNYNKNIFKDFHFASLALRAGHGLIFHNRRYYFNSLLDDFEPIYYDGLVQFIDYRSTERELNDEWGKAVFDYSFSNTFKPSFIPNIYSKKFEKNILNEYSKRVVRTESRDQASKMLTIFQENSRFLEAKIQNYDKFKEFDITPQIARDEYIDRVNKLDFEQDIISDLTITELGDIISQENDKKQIILAEDLYKLFSNINLNGHRTVYLPNKILDLSTNVQNIDLPFSGEALASTGMQVQINEISKEITFRQTQPNDWVLIKNTQVDNWRIELQGIIVSADQNWDQQRFNANGLTGCLNFYKTKFSSLSIYAKNGGCEDSINIVASEGDLSEVFIHNAWSDALDVDFSNIALTKLVVKRAGNDCFDVSGGDYSITDTYADLCGDKGVSVGEMSLLSIETLNVNNSEIGISVKDLSHAKINDATIVNTNTCYEAFKKKQEFGGGYLQLDALKCEGSVNVDNQSKVEKITYEF